MGLEIPSIGQFYKNIADKTIWEVTEVKSPSLNYVVKLRKTGLDIESEKETISIQVSLTAISVKEFEGIINLLAPSFQLVKE